MALYNQFITKEYTLTFNCKEPYYSQILSGEKTFEGRVIKGKWANIITGDIIHMLDDCQEGYTSFEVVSVVISDSFFNLHKLLGKQLLPRIAYDDHAGAAKIYSEWFSQEHINSYGVVAFELKKFH